MFAASSLGESEARRKHLLELRGIGLVTGQAGSGNTTVCRKVAAALHPGLYPVFYASLSTGNVMDMYKSIGWELGLPTERNRAAAFRVIRSEVTRLPLEAKQRPALMVDEAHHLRNEVLEDLRLLTNYQIDAESRLCLLLVGPTELRRRLVMAVHESLAQRIVRRLPETNIPNGAGFSPGFKERQRAHSRALCPLPRRRRRAKRQARRYVC